MATNSGGVQLFTTQTAGAILSQTVSTSLNVALLGLICINSLTVSIPSSIVPPAGGTQSSTGFTVGPVVNINNMRSLFITSTVAPLEQSLAIFSF
jgi:hypothetical protein